MVETSIKLLIGEVARAAGVNPQTVLFYERQGLIPKADRRSSGYREFEPETVDVIGFIQRAKELGFTLTEITELLSPRTSEGAQCEDVRTKAVEKLDLLEEKIRQLDAMRKALRELIRFCVGRGPVRNCSIIEAMRQECELVPHDNTLVRRKR